MQPNYYNNNFSPYSMYGQQPYQQQQMVRQNNKIDYLIVPTEDEARRYILNVGQTIIFKVADKNIMVERTLDFNGNSTMQFYDLRVDDKKSKSEYVKREEFDDLVLEFKNFSNYLKDKKVKENDEQ